MSQLCVVKGDLVTSRASVPNSDYSGCGELVGIFLEAKAHVFQHLLVRGELGLQQEAWTVGIGNREIM